jgi:hypothetical protein
VGITYAGTVVEGPSTRFVFKQTAADTHGELLRFEQFVKPGPAEKNASWSSQARWGCGQPVPPGTPHTFWNVGDADPTVHGAGEEIAYGRGVW